ncbi:MAG: cysteine desulfurase [Candidatus Kerfeldbacteria bacterium]
MFDKEKLKKDFPFLETDIVYLDNGATTQKPRQMVDAITDYYTNYSANVHRGIYKMSERADAAYEAVRDQVQELLNAEHREEIIFTSGTTLALNMAAQMLGQRMEEGDEIILTRLEHHANLIPWQMVAKQKKLKIKFLSLNEQEQIDPEQLRQLITEKTKVLSLTHVSNVSGYVTPVRELADIAHEHDMTVVVDAAQSTPHMPVDVQALGADMLAFSAHKMCGPTYVGVLYGHKDLLEELEPVLGGGSMILEVSMETATWADLPLKFEPGTPNIAGVIGFGASLAYLKKLGMDAIHKYMTALTATAYKALASMDGVKVFGPSDLLVRHGIFSLAVDGIHPHDMASILDEQNVAVRAGHHCAQPMMARWGVPATTRASFYFYNNEQDVDALVAAIQKAQSIFKV